MTPATYRALVVTTHGGTDTLRVQDRPLADPGPGQALVSVAASGINFIDVYQRQGIYPTPTPFVLGCECAGHVLRVGPGVQSVAVGDAVATAAGTGTHAERAIVAAAELVPVPEQVDLTDAAAAMLQGMTAHYLVNSTFAVDAGTELLVHAAAGGVGQLLIQLAKAKGAHVIGTVGSAAKVAVARAAGADEVIRYDEVSASDALVEAVRAASRGGVNVVYDGVGKATFEASLASLRPRGMLVLFGGASGQVPPFDLQRLNAGGSLFVTRPTLAHYLASREELLWRSGEILAAIADGTLRIAIGGRFTLDDAARAYDDLEGRRTTGKLLLVP